MLLLVPTAPKPTLLSASLVLMVASPAVAPQPDTLQLAADDQEVRPHAGPIVAMFLVKFDVHAGYTLEWSRKIGGSAPMLPGSSGPGEEVYSLKNIEFKAFPLGLHFRDHDMVYFIHHKLGPQPAEGQEFARILYGVLLFRQNLGDHVTSRDDVRMYALGVLVDPEVNAYVLNNLLLPTNVFQHNYMVPWRPTNYTLGTEYAASLERLLERFMEQPEGQTLYDELAQFYELRRAHLDPHLPPQPAKQGLHSAAPLATALPVMPKHRRGGSTTAELLLLQLLAPFDELAAQSLPPPPVHMIHQLTVLAQRLGPLLFTAWRVGLLRKRVLLYAPSSDLLPPVEQHCAFTYCLAILATLPREVTPVLLASGCKSEVVEHLQYYQPVYAIGVNDIDGVEKWRLKKGGLRQGFIATTTDEILLYKKSLYDVLVVMSGPSDGPSIVLLSAAQHEVPKVIRAQYFHDKDQQHVLKATPRDLRRTIAVENHSRVEEEEVAAADETPFEVLRQWWTKVTEPVLWQEFAWSGFMWWATAGEDMLMASEVDQEGLDTVDEGNGWDRELVELLNLLGYFQNMTLRLFSVLAELVCEQGRGGDGAEAALLHDELPLVVMWHDIPEMGLDPYSSADREFITELVGMYWGRPVEFGSGRICC